MLRDSILVYLSVKSHLFRYSAGPGRVGGSPAGPTDTSGWKHSGSTGFGLPATRGRGEGWGVGGAQLPQAHCPCSSQESELYLCCPVQDRRAACSWALPAPSGQGEGTWVPLLPSTGRGMWDWLPTLSQAVGGQTDTSQQQVQNHPPPSLARYFQLAFGWSRVGWSERSSVVRPPFPSLPGALPSTYWQKATGFPSTLTSCPRGRTEAQGTPCHALSHTLIPPCRLPSSHFSESFSTYGCVSRHF